MTTRRKKVDAKLKQVKHGLHVLISPSLLAPYSLPPSLSQRNETYIREEPEEEEGVRKLAESITCLD